MTADSKQKPRGQNIQLHPAIVALFYALALGAYLSRVIVDPNHFFQLALGNALASSWEFPVTDQWSVVGQGLPWRWSGWLYGLLLSLSETGFGERGVAWFILGVGWTFVTAALFAFTSISRSYFFAALVTTLLAVGSLEGSGVGPLHLGLGGFALILAILVSDLSSLLRAALLFAVTAAVANLSDLGAAVIVGSLVVALRKPRFDSVIPLLVGGLLTPYWGAEIGQQLVVEWPARIVFELETRGNLASVFDYGFAILLLLSLIVSLLLAARGSILRGGDIVLVLAATLFGMIYKPALPYSLVVLGYCAMLLWRDAPTEGAGRLGESLVRFRDGLARLPSVGTTWILLVLIIINVKKFMQEPVVPVLLPTRALDAVLDERLPDPVLHELAVGGYVAYRFSQTRDPRRLAYLDPRAVSLDPRSAKQESTLAKLSDGWGKLFERLPPRTVVVRTRSALWELLKRERGWKLAYQDNLTAAPENEGRVLEIPFGWAVFTRVEDVESAGEI